MAYSDQHLVQIVCYSDQHLVRIQTSGGWLYSDQHCTFVGTFVGIHQRDGGIFDLFVGLENENGLHMGTARMISGRRKSLHPPSRHVTRRLVTDVVRSLPVT